MKIVGKFTANIFAILFCLVVIVDGEESRTRNNLGNFDIEKVRIAALGADGFDTGKTQKTTDEVPSIKKTDTIGWVGLRITVYLLLIIGALFAVIYGIKRLGLAGKSKIGGGAMDMLEALPIGQNRTIVLVRVLDKVYLLAQTPTQVSLLDKIEGKAALELISSSKSIVSISQFKDVFNNFMGKIKKPV
jgi:flagellar biosynthetic protein FliO